ncbi:MAG: alpha/beta-type small acid-soluble spore protein [Clostridia bacterium]|jgi:hypothetical protein|nr:alpha/beta-type small acid-soluble spore protein [Clostridia bacterium]
MSNSKSKTAFDQLKYEIAKESGVNLKEGYNGDLTSKEAGTIGGNIVRKVFESYTGNNYFKGSNKQ